MDVCNLNQAGELIISSNKPFELIPFGNSSSGIIFCIKCKKRTETKDNKEILTKNNRKMMKGKCKICDFKKCKFVKNEIIGGEINIQPKKVNFRKNSDLKEIYYNPSTGFCGINELHRKSGINQQNCKEFLNQQNTYTLHKPVHKNFTTERVFVHDINDQRQSDLVEMIPYSEENDGFKYLLTVIDCFSKYAFVIPIKNKNGSTTSQAFQTIFKQRKPKKIQTDKGKEYYNKEINKLFKANNIIHFFTESDKKASIIEQFNRTIKEKMWKMFTFNNNHKWINILDDLVNNYNNSYHRSIKISPIKASDLKNKTIVHENLFLNMKHADEKIKGKFYEEELTLYQNIENQYQIEKILKRRTRNEKKQILIQWLGYPEKYNSWIPESNLSNL